MRQSHDLEVSGKKIVVVGLGVSGLWAARWLAWHGARVTVSETKSGDDLDPVVCKEICKLGVTLETGGHNRDTFLNAEMIIISPGIPHNMESILAAIKRGIHVMGELELASRLIDTPVIAVTGTNGKSTVTSFLGHLLENVGLEIFVGGNIGTPLMAYAAGERKADYVVVEVSSFQLDTIETFCPYVSIILNISPDHLDRYPHYEAYVQSKLKIFKNQMQGHYVILNDDDERLTSVHPSSGVSVFRYGLEKKEGRHAFVISKEIRVCLNGEKSNCFRLESFSLPGKQNLENLLAVVLAAEILDIEPSVIQKSINEFEGLPNRLEQIGELDGVIFFNDSKATNVDAAVRAVESFDKPLILIAGGRHKGADYAPLVRASEGRVKEAVFLGEAKGLLAKSFEGVVPFSVTEDMEGAVSMAFARARSGDVVLLAPACSSFDMFSDYSERGGAFKAAVERLACG